MTQWVQTLATNSYNPSSIRNSHGGRRKQTPHRLFSDLYTDTPNTTNFLERKLSTTLLGSKFKLSFISAYLGKDRQTWPLSS